VIKWIAFAGENIRPCEVKLGPDGMVQQYVDRGRAVAVLAPHAPTPESGYYDSREEAVECVREKLAVQVHDAEVVANWLREELRQRDSWVLHLRKRIADLDKEAIK
jgi:hypothetical protein